MAKKSELVQGLLDKGAIASYDDGQSDIETVAESDLSSVASDEAFMNEKVKIMVFPSTSPNAPPYAQPNVNGEQCVVFRNTPQVIKRKHLEVLARMKETHVTQDLTPGPTGEITMGHLRGHTALAYPFTVLEDKNPKGPAWLAQVLAERG